MNTENFNKQKRYDKTYLEIAKVISQLSHAKRKKVGCLLVKNSVIYYIGMYNI